MRTLAMQSTTCASCADLRSQNPAASTAADTARRALRSRLSTASLAFRQNLGATLKILKMWYL
ncbi:MAG: hypothetical protein ABIL09_18870 [Gemmatimonadota bacterium]